MAVAAGVWAAVASARLFPYLTVDKDEAVYLLQADTLRHGRLFPPAPPGTTAGALLPWLSAHVGDHYVPKYTPVWPAFVALAHLLTGTDRAAIAVVSAAVVVVTYLLAHEVLGSAARGLVAAAFLVLSPLFLLQAVSFLSYLPNLLLLETFALCLLAGVRRGSRVLLTAAGLTAGLALFARPFDALLVILPFAAWFVVEHRARLQVLVARAGWLALGAAPVVALVLGFFYAATGNPLRSPFTLTSKSDMPGFGVHRIYAGDAGVEYGAKQAWHGLAGHSVLLSFWAFGGLVLIGLAGLAVRRSPTRARYLGLVALTVPAGYLFFWGSYIISRWDGPWHVGPFYYLPVLVPLVVLGADGFARLWRWERGLAALALVSMAAVSGLVLVRALDRQAASLAADRALHAPLSGAHFDRALVFLPPLATDHLLTTFVEARNPTLDGKVLWALDHGPENVAVARTFPDRTAYVLTADGDDPPALSRLRAERGPVVPLRVTVSPVPGGASTAGPLALRVVFAGRVDTFVIGPEVGTQHLDLALTVGATTLTGASVTGHTTSAAASGDLPSIALLAAAERSSPDRQELGWAAVQATPAGDGGVDALVPQDPITSGPLQVVAAP